MTTSLHKTEKFSPGDHVVYTPQNEEGTVVRVSESYVFVCYGLPGSTPKATKPSDLIHISWR